jgi:ubiquinone/menaquinone biosynthesis C-methylase UbiE
VNFRGVYNSVFDRFNSGEPHVNRFFLKASGVIDLATNLLMVIHPPENQGLEEFRKFQLLLIPVTSKYFGKKCLDIGCGNGLTSYVLRQEIGVEFTLCDVVDIRHDLTKHLPFYKIENGHLPFTDNSFDSGYLQYVLHHVETEKQMTHLLKEASRISGNVIIIEEIASSETDVIAAVAFDKKVNDVIHPGIEMKVFKYYRQPQLETSLKEAGLKVIYHEVLSNGSEENGFLETHVFVAKWTTLFD